LRDDGAVLQVSVEPIAAPSPPSPPHRLRPTASASATPATPTTAAATASPPSRHRHRGTVIAQPPSRHRQRPTAIVSAPRPRPRPNPRPRPKPRPRPLACALMSCTPAGSGRVTPPPNSVCARGLMTLSVAAHVPPPGSRRWQRAGRDEWQHYCRHVECDRSDGGG